MNDSHHSEAAGDHLKARILIPLLLAILLTATIVRCYALARDSLWQDELSSMECSTGRGLTQLPSETMFNPPPSLTSRQGAGPWWDVWRSMGSDNHPPLYFVLLRLWRDLFGDTDLAMRSLSVVTSVAAIGFFFDAVRQSSGDATALWAAGIMAAAGEQIYHSREIRGYALLIALGAVACAMVMRIEYKGCTARRLLILGAASIGMVATHYYGVVPVGVIGLYGLIRFRGPTRGRVFATLLIAATLGAACVGPVLLSQLHVVSANNSYGIEPAKGHLQRTLIRISTLPIRFLSSPVAWHIPFPFLAALAYLVPLPLLRHRRELLFWYLMFIAPVIFVAAVDLVRHASQLDMPRYMLMASLGLFVLIAAIVPRKWGRVRFIPPALTVLMCACSVPFYYGSFWLDCRGLAASLEAAAQPGDKIILGAVNTSSWSPSTLCMGITHYRYPPAAPVLLLNAPASSGVLKQLEGPGRIWLVCGPGTSPQYLFPGAKILHSQTLRQGGLLCEVLIESDSHPQSTGSNSSRTSGD